VFAQAPFRGEIKGDRALIREISWKVTSEIEA